MPIIHSIGRMRPLGALLNSIVFNTKNDDSLNIEHENKKEVGSGFRAFGFKVSSIVPNLDQNTTLGDKDVLNLYRILSH